MDKYQQVIVCCNTDYREILMAEFAAIGFDSFQETEAGFITFFENEVENIQIDNLINRYQGQTKLSYTVEDVKQVNWNKKWEESYDPIIIDKKCIVRASFHKPQPEYPLEIIVTPKMSFGTGHHETTYLMMKAQLELNHHHKTVLEAGCGTGILSILAGKLGANNITAYDNDKWVINNAQENFKINHTDGKVLTGTIQELINTPDFTNGFDIILANINRNILLGDIPFYANALAGNGHLLLSGFYEEDLPGIEDLANKNGLKLNSTDTKNGWCMAHFHVN